MIESGVIFDVDGVLLNLTRQEEDIFFKAFENHIDVKSLSRDWNAYRIRNDEDIIAEIVERHGLAATLNAQIKQKYLAHLQAKLDAQSLLVEPIAGAHELLSQLKDAQLGIATANFREAAKMRLGQVGLWQPVSSLAFGADGGGHKHHILARLLETLQLPKSSVVYIGDNINDVEAGLKNNVHFIGFSTDENRLRTLELAGAKYLSSNHIETLNLINRILNTTT